MCTLAKPKSHRLLLVAVALMFSAVAQARNQQVVIFGDSFSDTGNQFAVNGIVNEPPYDSLNPFGVATDPYASHNFTNGTTWIELVADEVAHPQSAKAALAGGKKAGNYAWGQAPAYAAPGSPAPQPLSAQVASYLANVNHDVSSETLHVIFIGRSDVIDALVLLGGGAPFNVAVERVGLAAAAIQESIDALVSAGANRFLIMNTPNVGLNPSLTSPGGKFIATCFAGLLNDAVAPTGCPPLPIPFGINDIAANLESSSAEVTSVDVFGFTTALSTNPSDFGFANTTDSCVMPNQPPFACAAPNEHLFWDGGHYTSAVHRLLSSVVINALGHEGDN